MQLPTNSLSNCAHALRSAESQRALLHNSHLNPRTNNRHVLQSNYYTIYHLTSDDGITAVVLALRTFLMIPVSRVHVSNTTPCGCLLALTFTILPIGYTLLPLPLITVSLLVACGINGGV